MIEDETSTRRVFCLGCIYGFGALIGGALAVPAAIYLFLPPRPRLESPWVDAGDISQLEPQNPLEMTFRRTRADGWKVTNEKASAWVVKMSDQEVIAFSPFCTHLGCAYHWNPEKHEFECPCHGSVFSIDGKVLHGPAPRPLDRLEVKRERNELWLGPGRKSTEA